MQVYWVQSLYTFNALYKYFLSTQIIVPSHAHSFTYNLGTLLQTPERLKESRAYILASTWLVTVGSSTSGNSLYRDKKQRAMASEGSMVWVKKGNGLQRLAKPHRMRYRQH